MLKKVALSDNIFWVGVNDRHTERFENYMPIPHGVSYNAYLIEDEKNTVIDTVEVGFVEEYILKIKSILGEKQVDYLIVNHVEPDHSGSIKRLLCEYPQMRIVGNAKTIPMLQGFYGIGDHCIAMEEGATLSTGKHTLQFFTVPMVHWPESMVTYETSQQILFSNDAFGSFGALDGGVFDDETRFEFYEEEMRRYYSNIVGKYGVQVQKAMAKLNGVSINTIAPSHGPVWRENIAKVIQLYDRWSKCEAEEGVVIIYGTMYGNTARMADVIARSVAEEGIRNIRVFDVSKTHSSYLISEIWKYKGVILGSCAYNGVIYPPMGSLLKQLLLLMPKNRLLGLFGSMSWGGGGVRNLDEFAENIKWEVVAPSVEIKHAAQSEDEERLAEIGKAMAGAVRL
ncbi:MAG: FprA family A-type flavoprotein [Bacteroidales bacterium]|nr:FprA family A-type flavoprotein [Bacteroidales bacterium]